MISEYEKRKIHESLPIRYEKFEIMGEEIAFINVIFSRDCGFFKMNSEYERILCNINTFSLRTPHSKSQQIVIFPVGFGR